MLVSVCFYAPGISMPLRPELAGFAHNFQPDLDLHYNSKPLAEFFYNKSFLNEKQLHFNDWKIEY